MLLTFMKLIGFHESGATPRLAAACSVRVSESNAGTSPTGVSCGILSAAFASTVAILRS